MKLIRHILSHSILIGFVASLVLGFYYRTALFPANWNEQISQQVVRVAGPYAPRLHAFAAPVIENTTQTVAKAPSPEPVSEPTPAVEPEATTEVATLPADVPQVEESTASETITDKPVVEVVAAKPVDDISVAAPVEKAEPASTEAEAPVPAVPVAEPVKEIAQATRSTDTKATTETVAEPSIEKPASSSVAMAVDQQEENKPVTPEVAQAPETAEPVTASTQDSVAVSEVTEKDDEETKGSSDQDSVGIDDLWRQARTAYGQGDLAAALQHYLTLSEQESDNPDVFGELGNVYYARGNLPEAGQAYYEAAVRLIELGQMRQINYLVRVIEGLSPDSATKLKQRLMR